MTQTQSSENQCTLGSSCDAFAEQPTLTKSSGTCAEQSTLTKTGSTCAEQSTLTKTGSTCAEQPFYKDGLNFACQQCSHCCRDFPGMVLLDKTDLERLARWAELTPGQFILAYCRWIDTDSGEKLLSLREKSNYDCIFWQNGGCTAYSARPVQCRTYPFWTHVIKDQSSWDKESKECPGINKGPLHSAEEISGQLAAYKKRVPISKTEL